MFRKSYQSLFSNLLATSLLTVSSIFTLGCPPGYCQDAAGDTVLRGVSETTASAPEASIDREILKKELELIKLNAEFRTHYMKPVKGKSRRLKLYDTAGGAVANAGDITLMSQFWRYWKRPGDALANRGRLEAGPIIVAVAYITLGGLYAADGLFDLVSDYNGKRKGFDAKTVFNRAVALKKDIDKLLESRANLVGSAASQDEKAVHAARGNILRDIENLSLVEFSRIYVDSRKRRVARDLTTLGTIAVCATGASGAFQVVHGVDKVKLKQVGGGGITFLVSGTTLTAAPALIHGGAAVGGKISAGKLEKALGELQCRTIGQLESHLRELGDLGKSSSAISSEESRRYEVLAKLLKDRQEYLDREARRKKLEVIESFLSYAARGGPQIAWGAMLTRAGYHYHLQPARALRGVAQAATVNEVSWGIWEFDTIQKAARNEIGFHSDGKVPAQDQPFGASNSRLVQLDEMVK